MHRIVAHWTKGWIRDGWTVQNDPRTVLSFRFAKRPLRRVRKGLYAVGTHSWFNKLLGQAVNFVSWWGVSLGERETAYVFDMVEGGWQIPWELLLEQRFTTEDRLRTCMVRRFSDSPVTSPDRFSDPLRILFLQGGSRGLDIEGEFSRIQHIYDMLPPAVRSRIAAPQHVHATKDSIGDAVARIRPHVLWFSGHADYRKHTMLQMSNNEWITTDDMVAAIREARVTPHFCVFLACSTATAPGLGPLPVRPDLIEALQQLGVLSILAMQAPISDVGAIVIAEQLIRGLAAGLSFERAVSRGRAELLAAEREGSRKLDWATPVVWSSVNPPSTLTWAIGDMDTIQAQLFALRTSSFSRASAAEVPLQTDAGHTRIAEALGRHNHVWVIGKWSEPEHRAQWLGAMRVFQGQSNQPLLVVECDPVANDGGLATWATMVKRTTLPTEAPTDLLELLDELGNSPTLAWTRVCSRAGIVLVVIDPPASSVDWFWRALKERDTPTIVFAGDAPMSDNWATETLSALVDPQVIENVLQRNPRIVRALAMLRTPLLRSYLSLPELREEPPETNIQWSALEPVVIQTQAGPILAASAREKVLGRMDEAQKRSAHEDCLYLLDDQRLQLKQGIRRERLTHLLAIDNLDAAAIEAALLISECYQRGLVSEVYHVAHSHPTLPGLLSGQARLTVAAACLQLGQVGEARGWLAQESPSSPLRAWRHALLAELEKAEGNRDDCLAEIDRALAVCRESLETHREEDLLKLDALCRHDRARILQFLFRRFDEARQTYESLIAELRDNSHLELLLATVWRNYAECLRTQARDGTGSPPVSWQQAKDAITTAEDLARRFPGNNLLAEVLYQESRLYASLSDRDEEHKTLLKAKEAARESGHGMLAAIIDARLFWMQRSATQPLTNDEPTRWAEIEQRLATYARHGWAVRSRIDWRLRLARALAANQQSHTAIEVLRDTQAILDEHPAFSEGSDRRRRALVMAGLLVLSSDGTVDQEHSWREFLEANASVRKWVNEQGHSDPHSIWQGEE